MIAVRAIVRTPGTRTNAVYVCTYLHTFVASGLGARTRTRADGVNMELTERADAAREISRRAAQKNAHVVRKRMARARIQCLCAAVRKA